MQVTLELCGGSYPVQTMRGGIGLAVPVIGQAQGIVMERRRADADQALALLTRPSQNRNPKFRHSAADLVETGVVAPVTARPGKCGSVEEQGRVGA